MQKHITLRELTADARAESERLARSRTGRMAAYDWMRRFNAGGVPGLMDRPRSGRGPAYTADHRAEVVAAALTRPAPLGLPFGSRALDRLAAYRAGHRKVPIERSRVDEILVAEGLRRPKQETWFGEEVGPGFAAKSDCDPRQAEIGPGSAASDRHG